MLDTYKWLERATANIYFGPDRRAVSRELEDHIQELRRRKEAAGLDGAAAERAALEAMGSPEDIAEPLGRLHRPWWGWIWRCSQGLLAAALLWVLAAAALQASSLSGRAPILPEGDVRLPRPGEPRTVAASWEPAGSVRLGHYRFSVPLAWVETWPVPEKDGGPRECCRLVVYLRADTWRFWEPCDPSQYMILRHAVTGSGGRRYAYDTGVDESLFCESGGGRAFTSWYLVELALPSPEDVPEWVDIPVGYGACRLRVDLEREVVA